MHLRTKLALLVVMIAALLPAAGSAYACDGSHNHDTGGVAAASYTMRSHHGHGLLSASAQYLGLSTDQLKAKLSSGQSLAQVANATSGKSSAGLVDYLTGLVKTKLDSLVSAGKLTSAQETAILARIQDKLNQVVNATFTASSRSSGDRDHD